MMVAGGMGERSCVRSGLFLISESRFASIETASSCVGCQGVGHPFRFISHPGQKNMPPYSVDYLRIVREQNAK